MWYGRAIWMCCLTIGLPCLTNAFNRLGTASPSLLSDAESSCEYLILYRHTWVASLCHSAVFLFILQCTDCNDNINTDNDQFKRIGHICVTFVCCWQCGMLCYLSADKCCVMEWWMWCLLQWGCRCVIDVPRHLIYDMLFRLQLC